MIARSDIHRCGAYRRTHAVRRPRAGATAAELAILVPVLVLMILGCVDFGRFAYSYIAVTNGARAGAGYGSNNPYTTATLTLWQTNVRQTVKNEMSSIPGYVDSRLTVTATPITESTTQWRAHVQVNYPYTTIINWPLIPHSITLTRVVEMRAVR